MKHYKHLIFDADDTLINFGKDERRAFRIAFGKGASAEMLEDLRRFEYAHWDELRLHEVHDPEIQKNFHAYYYEHLKAVFDYAEEKYALGESRKEKENAFFEALCLAGHEEEGALSVIKALSSRYDISIATNGLAAMQRGRLREFLPYVQSMFISEEIGAIKPTEKFGKAVLSVLRAQAEECLWVGDSPSSDVALANRLHMDCVWYNPAHRASVGATYEIAALKELKALLL